MNRYACCFVLIAACASAACGDGDPVSTESPRSEREEIGNLNLKLVGTDSSGRDYRLRNATFDIREYYYYYPFPPYGDAGGDAGFSTSVSSETDPDAPVISLRVVEGSYYVGLANSDWYLERFEGGTWTRVEQAVLLSQPTQYAYVYANGVTGVFFRFGVDGELIDFRGGELQIGIEIEQPGDVPDGGGFIGGRDAGFGGVGGGGGGDAGAGEPL